MNWLFASLACFSKGMFIFLCHKLLTVKVNRALGEVHNATGISEGASSLVHKGGLLEGGGGHLVRFPIGNVIFAQHVDRFLSRIRMEQNQCWFGCSSTPEPQECYLIFHAFV